MSSLVNRDERSQDVIVRATTDTGLVVAGELKSCSGADVKSVLGALEAMTPFVIGHDPWESERIRLELWHRGIWSWRQHTACFAYPGIDTCCALGHLWEGRRPPPCTKLFGGKVRERAELFLPGYCSQGSTDHIVEQAGEGVGKGFHVFYLKVGLDIEAELEMVRALRQTIGPKAKIRLDANGAWNVKEALRNLARLDAYQIDFIEQPVVQDPLANMQEVREHCSMAVSANEGLWTTEDALRQMTARTADVYCSSPYFAGSLSQFRRLCWFAALSEIRTVCQHTHGELGNYRPGLPSHFTEHPEHHRRQSTDRSHDDGQSSSSETIPISNGPDWGVPERPGIGVEIVPEKLAKYHELYRQRGQFVPYDPELLGTELYR